MLTRIVARLRAIVFRRRIAAEIDEELHDHVERAIEANLARGMTRAEARRRALADLGGLTQANSLAVSAMVAWFRRASRQDKTLTFINVSEPMKKIIRVSGLQDILLGIS